jgi:SAM-dependent methyltransferase
MTTSTELLHIVKSTDQDFEWYPTTNEIIDALVKDYRKNPHKSVDEWGRTRYSGSSVSVLDIGAGNGKVLSALVKAGIASDCYAIEKSIPLLASLPKEFVVVGTEFWEQSLYDKGADITFSNPPYSEFEAWAERILMEAGSETIYLVIPKRWEDSHRIKNSLRGRKAKVVGEFDFQNSEDRRARAIVHLIRVDNTEKDEAFDAFFDSEFADLLANYRAPKEPVQENSWTPDPKDLVDGTDLVTALVQLYRADVAKVQKSYNHLCGIDVSLLIELDVTIDSIKAKLRNRLSELKKQYWKRVFDNLDRITDRLTSKNRDLLMKKIFAHQHVDFTVQNAYAIILWVIRHANDHIDDQVLTVYSKMVEAANVINYQSNKRVFQDQRWRYADEENPNSHFYLNFRIVLERVGGIYTSSYSWESRKGLQECAYEFLQDILTVANNLGFKAQGSPHNHEWVSNKLVTFYYRHETEGMKTLMTVRAFKNGNLHLMLANEFALTLNVEHGRLKGWVNDPGEVMSEMPEVFSRDLESAKAAVAAFGSNHKICPEALGFLLEAK